MVDSMTHSVARITLVYLKLAQPVYRINNDVNVINSLRGSNTHTHVHMNANRLHKIEVISRNLVLKIDTFLWTQDAGFLYTTPTKECKDVLNLM